MVLENLALLDASLRAADCRAARFRVRCGGATLSVVYLNDTCPQELLFQRSDAPTLRIRVLLQSGHGLEPLALRPVVEPEAPGPIASPAVRRFLEDFALAIPRTLAEAERATPELILQHSPDVEEPEKIYFTGWRALPADAARPNHPNLQKTRRAFGQDAFELCLHLQQASCWSDQPGARRPFELPDA